MSVMRVIKFQVRRPFCSKDMTDLRSPR